MAKGNPYLLGPDVDEDPQDGDDMVELTSELSFPHSPMVLFISTMVLCMLSFCIALALVGLMGLSVHFAEWAWR